MFAEIIAAQAFARSILGRFGFCKGNWFCHSVMHGSFWYWYPGVTAQVGLAAGTNPAFHTLDGSAGLQRKVGSKYSVGRTGQVTKNSLST